MNEILLAQQQFQDNPEEEDRGVTFIYKIAASFTQWFVVIHPFDFELPAPPAGGVCDL